MKLYPGPLRSVGRIQQRGQRDLLQGANPKGGYHSIIWPNFSKNCMNLRKIGPREGQHARAPAPKPANEQVFRKSPPAVNIQNSGREKNFQYIRISLFTRD